MAAEVLAAAGVRVQVYDRMASVGRKFLLAGRGGLNLTHGEAHERFVQRYGPEAAAVWLRPMLDTFGAQQVRAWAQGLGIDTFVGSSNRVFPTDMKAAPLLRAWLHRLRQSGVQFHMRHRWVGWKADGSLRFERDAAMSAQQSSELVLPPAGPQHAVVLALGGGSWPRMGSDAAWVPWLAQAGVPIKHLLASNCGFDVLVQGREGWSPFLRERFAGQPVKPVALSLVKPDGEPAGHTHRQQGEFVLTDTGVEGSLIYAFSSRIQAGLQAGQASVPPQPFTVWLDLLPQHTPERVLAEVSHPRGSRSLGSHLKSRLGLNPLKVALLHEMLDKAQLQDATALAQAIKALPLTLVRPRPLAEAISTAGGVARDALNASLMLTQQPGTFCAGEMLDWDAPTGGYLLTACLATGRKAGLGAVQWLQPDLTHQSESS